MVHARAAPFFIRDLGAFHLQALTWVLGQAPGLPRAAVLRFSGTGSQVPLPPPLPQTALPFALRVCHTFSSSVFLKGKFFFSKQSLRFPPQYESPSSRFLQAYHEDFEMTYQVCYYDKHNNTVWCT